MVNGTIYDENNPTGTEVFPNASTNGCDSTVTTHVSILTGTEDILEKSFDLNIYPNPTKGNLYIDINLPEKGFSNLSFSLFGPLGKKVRSWKKQNLPPGAHHFSYNMEALPNGVYFLEIKTNMKTVKNSLLVIAY